MAPKKPPPKYLIDLRGMQAALSSRDNAIAGLVAASITSGEMRLTGDIQDQFHFEELLQAFKSIPGKRYERPDDLTYGRSSLLMEQYGAPLIGIDPSNEAFEMAMLYLTNLAIQTGVAIPHFPCIPS